MTQHEKRGSQNVECCVWKPKIRRFYVDFSPLPATEAAQDQSNFTDGFISSSSNVEVRLGEHDIWEPDGTEQHILSAKFIRHPDYDSRTQDSDIMLIKLSRPATLNSYVRPAALPSECASDGTMCQVSGWGSLRPSNEGCELHPECTSRPF